MNAQLTSFAIANGIPITVSAIRSTRIVASSDAPTTRQKRRDIPRQESVKPARPTVTSERTNTITTPETIAVAAGLMSWSSRSPTACVPRVTDETRSIRY